MSTTLNWKDGALPWLVLTDWYACFQELYKGIEGEEWEEMCDSYEAMSKALGVESCRRPRRKSPVGHESSQGQTGRVL